MGYTPGKLGGGGGVGVRPVSQTPYPIDDENVRFSLAYL